MGVNPNDGRQTAMSGQMAAQQALGLATAGNKARVQARQEGYQLTDRANNALAGYPSMSANSVGMGAGVAGMGQQGAVAGPGRHAGAESGDRQRGRRHVGQRRQHLGPAEPSLPAGAAAGCGGRRAIRPGLGTFGMIAM